MLDHIGLDVGDYERSKAFYETGVHVAFEAPDRAAVDAFHAAALEAGATDNGAPGVREIYHPSYYGAYVLDPDGNNVEACCHRPE
jgi:catechol 2,3-dioxygenase-like lactoylglutathione lyase family enzyme